MSEHHILYIGNIMEGIRFYGPFDTKGDAQNYAEVFYPDEEWSITIPHKPECDNDGEWTPDYMCRFRNRIILAGSFSRKS